ncbi:MAG TPA: hypothetical protein VK177_12445, partial [Flavobacteriales bacterium]|nr:hypothetical protein [Flavobacteriales bacterium]
MKCKMIAGIFLACFMLLGVNGFSQGGLNKLKEKAKEKTEKEAREKAEKTKDKTTDVKVDAGKTDGGKSDEKKEEGTAVKTKAPDPESSPAVINIRKFRNSRSFMEAAIKKNYDTERNLTDMRKTLDQLKQEDPNWVEIPQFETEYAEYKRQVDELKALDATKRGIEDVAMALRSVNNDIWKFIDYGDDWLSKAKVEKLKKDAEGKEMGDYQKGVLADADKFFAEKSAQVKTKALESVKKDGNSSFLKVNREKPEFLERFTTSPGPSYSAEQLNPAIKIMKAALGIVPGDADLQARLSELEGQKAELLDYEKNGEFSKDIARKAAYD